MDINQLMARLGRTGQVFVAGAVLAFILSFLPWYTASVSFMGHSSSGSLNAWDAKFGAWFPCLLLLALGVVTVLWALDVIKWAPLFLWTVGAATGLLAAIIIILRWVTYPSASEADGFGGSASSGAGWALYVGLIVAIATAVFGYLGFTGAGGDIKNLSGALNPGGGQGGQGGPGGPGGQGGYNDGQYPPPGQGGQGGPYGQA